MKRHFHTSHEEGDMHKQWDPTKRSVYDYYSRKRRSPSPHTRESSKREHSRVTNRSAEDYYNSFRPSPKERRKTKNLPQKTENRQPDSRTDVLGDFISGIHDLPNNTFFKILDKKLDKLSIEGFTQQAALAEFISNAASSLPPEVKAVVERKMFRKAGTEATPPSSNVASCQNVPYHLGNVNSPYTNTYIPSSNKNYSSNMASSSKTCHSWTDSDRTKFRL